MRLRNKLEWRRNKVQELQSRGYHTVDEIANRLQLPRSTIGKDIVFLKNESKVIIRKYIDERLPEEYERIMVGLNSILRNIWDITDQAEIETKEKLQAYSLIKECYSMKLDLLTNPAVLDEASSFIAKYKDKNNINRNEIETDSENKKKEIKKDLTAESSDSTSSLTKTTNKTF
jgi:hypothetical protein